MQNSDAAPPKDHEDFVRVRNFGLAGVKKYLDARRKSPPSDAAPVTVDCKNCKKLEQWVHDLQSGMFINCVYCGHRYGPDDEVAPTMQQALYDHIAECPKHPLSAMKRRAERAEARLTHPEDAPGGPTEHDMGRCGHCGAEGTLQWFVDSLDRLKGEDTPGGPAKEEDPHWPYIHSVAGDMHGNCGGQLRYRVLNDDHDDRKYRCDKCGKQWVEEGPDA